MQVDGKLADTSSAEEIQRDFEALIRMAHRVSADVGHEVEEVLKAGREEPLSRDEAHRLLTRLITVLRRGAQQRGDDAACKSLDGDVGKLVEEVLRVREDLRSPVAPNGQQRRVMLEQRNGIGVSAVRPRPCFHGKEIAMNAGFVKTTDVALWPENERLDIHLNQFRQKEGREPSSEELLDIMLSRMELPGLTGDDQFEIVQLARSIAVNGVRKPPILDIDGTPIDGNRRLAACNYILNNPEFDSVQKRRAEYVYVWQLTEHATPDERDAVIVSLNFEPDCKEPWPEYIKARKLYEEWQAMLAVEPRRPGPQRQAQLKRELSIKFALGPDTTTVNRYLKMVDWANEFEDYHINQKTRDKYEVKHRANEYFQYFDEIAKGERSGVANVLRNDDAYRHLVFDLLFQGKFKNWKLIRDLKYTYENEDALAQLRKARDTDDVEAAEQYIDEAVSVAKLRRAEARTVGANTRIEVFVKWLEELPVKAFRDDIKPENLERLLDALKLVERQAKTVRGGGEGAGEQ